MNALINWLYTELRGMQPRNQRLLACAFMRTVWDALDVRSRQAVLVAERLADGEATEDERYQFHDTERLESWPARATCFVNADAAAYQTLRRLIEGRASHRIRFNPDSLRQCIGNALCRISWFLVSGGSVMKAPTTKAEFYARYYAGEFGNRPRLFKNAAELIESDYHGNLTLRDNIAGGPCYYGWDAQHVRRGWFPYPFGPSCRMNESMPDDTLVIQGNVWMGSCGLALEYSCAKNIGHRQAVRHPYRIDVHGLRAYATLRTLMPATDFDDLMELLDLDGVVEFGTYSIPVGVIPNRRNIIWEVRAY